MARKNLVVGRNDPEWEELRKRLKLALPPYCWVCGEYIDRTISGRLPRGWTLDHVKPLSRHPELALDPSNLRPAHNVCNSTRGADGDIAIKASRRR